MASPPKRGPGKGKVYIPREDLTSPVWERQPDETPKQWAAFKTYRDLGIERTLNEAARVMGCPINGAGLHINGWYNSNAIVWRWRERARTYDDFVETRTEKAKMRAREKVAAQDAARAERRRRDSIEDLYQLGRRFAAKANAILDLPIVEIEIEADDTGIRHIHKPARGMTPATAAQCADRAASLQMAALTAASKPLEEYTPAELHAIADAMMSKAELEAELAAMDAEDDRRRILAIEERIEIVEDDEDESGDEAD